MPRDRSKMTPEQRERERERNRRTYARNRERIKEQRVANRASNPEKYNAYQAAYYRRNRAKCSARSVEWQRNFFAQNPERELRKIAIEILRQRCGCKLADLKPEIIAAKIEHLRLQRAIREALGK